MDIKLRDLARRAELDPDVRVEWLAQRLRLGTLSQAMLELAGYCGDAAARRLLNEDCSCGIGPDPWEHADQTQGRCRDRHFMSWVRGFSYWGNKDTVQLEECDQPQFHKAIYGREVILRAVLASAQAIETSILQRMSSSRNTNPVMTRTRHAITVFQKYVDHRSPINDVAVRAACAGGIAPAFDFHRVIADLREGWLEVLDAGSSLVDTRPAISKALIEYALREVCP